MTTETTTQPRARKSGRRYGWTLLALPVLIGAVSLSVARAHGPGGPGGGPEGFMQHRIERVLESVNASDAQKTQIKSIFEGSKPQLKALHEQEAALRKQIRDALTAPTIDANAIERLRQQQVQLMDKTSALFTQNLVSAAKVLTADQRKQVADHMAQHMGQHRGWRHGHGDEGGAPSTAPKANGTAL